MTYIGHVFGTESVLRYRKQRGPRYFIDGTIRPREYHAQYASTAEEADRIRTRLEEEGHYQVTVTPPEGAVDLPAHARARADARRAYEEQNDLLRAAVNRRAEQMSAESGGEPNESQLAREAGVDRMTIRKWLGKD